MKYIYTLLPVLLPVGFAASLGREASSEERLRDHISMFRHVLHGNNELFQPGDISEKPPTILSSSFQEQPEVHEGDSDGKENLARIQNLASVASSRDTNKNDFIGVVPGIQPAETTEAKTPEADGEFRILPVPTKANIQPLVSVGFKTPAKLEVSPEKQTKAKPKADSSSSKSGKSKRPYLEPAPNKNLSLSRESLGHKPTNGTFSGTEKDSKINLHKGQKKDLKDKNANNSNPKETESPHSVPTGEKLEVLDNTSPPNQKIEFEDYFGDERLSSLLADGLKQLLKNQSDFSAVFNFPELQKTSLPSSTSTNDPSSITFTAITSTTTVTATKSTITGEPTITNDYSKPTDTESTDKTQESGLSGDVSKEKANLNSGHDLTLRMRSLPPDSGRPRRSKKPKKFVQPVNVTEVIDPPKKLHLKDLLDQGSLDLIEEPVLESPEPESLERSDDQIPGKTKHKLRPGQQSLSEIRKVYFQSLERGTNEDLITYFHRIYPELHHLVGKAPAAGDYLPDAELEILLENLLPELLKSKPSAIVPPKLSYLKNVPVTVLAPKKKEILEETETNFTMGKEIPEIFESLEESYELTPSLYTNFTEPAKMEHTNVLERISAKFHKLTLDNIFHNPFDHSVTSEATNLAELYPSVIGAVIFALFLILL